MIKFGAKLVLAIIILSGSIVIGFGDQAKAAGLTYSISTTTGRGLCVSGTPVDFTLSASAFNLNQTTGVVTYNQDITWSACNAAAAATRAYAVYDNSGPNKVVCPLSGWYTGGDTNDCVKYIGNPRYGGASRSNGTGLNCDYPSPNAHDGDCIYRLNGSLFKVADYPSHGEPWSTTQGIPKAYVISNWVSRKTVAGSEVIRGRACQYYKIKIDRSKGWNNNVNHINNQCMSFDITISWSSPPDFYPTAGISSPGISGAEIEEGSPATSFASIENKGGPGNVNYNRYYWYDVNGDGNYVSGDGDAPINNLAPLSGSASIGEGGRTSLPDYFTTVTSNGGRYKNICTSLETAPPNRNSGVCYKIVRRPYFKVYNGDINAAIKTCNASTTTGTIKAYNLGSGDYKGSGTSIAAFAAGQIEGFVSAMNRTSDKPKYLTFANTGDGAASSTYGGNGLNATSSSCMSVDDIPANGHTINGVHSSGDDVFISGDNTYGNFNLNNIPSHTVITKGNIYIGANVANLSGVFKAGGTIYTCAVNSDPPTEDEIRDNCNNQLTVQGALIAKDIRLTRISGSLISAPAETIIFSPEVWVKSVIGQQSIGDNLGTKYDAILNMPPVL